MYRPLFPVLLFLLFTVPASGLSLSPGQEGPLSAAAAKLKRKDFVGARDAALAVAETAAGRDFIAGTAALRAQDNEAAAELLRKSAEKFPLLGDYALLYRAQALQRLNRQDDAVAAVGALVKSWPDSPLVRQAELLYADLLFARGSHREAVVAYEKFIEKYPSGNDSITALFQSALCREELREFTAAATIYRRVWLSYPASPLATKADAALKRLAATTTIAPYHPDELLRRANTLYDLNRFADATAAFDSLLRDPQTSAMTDRLLLKAGQSRFRARKYGEAEETFARLFARVQQGPLADEAQFWLARARDRAGHKDEAIELFVKLAKEHPSSQLADDALLEAALTLKGKGKKEEARAALERVAAEHQGSPLRNRALWELAWDDYLSRRYAEAIERMKPLAATADYRERALYWMGKALAARGDADGAQQATAKLMKEFPFGFYAFTLRKAGTAGSDLPRVAGDFRQALPLPQGYDRIKALLSLGLPEEARREIASTPKKNGKKPLAAMARLYLEAEDYNGALALLRREKKDEDGRLWPVEYPLPFPEPVREGARKHGLSEALIYAIIRQESNFLPTALSPVGAMGLMQLMPSTARATAKTTDFSTDTLNDPSVNIRYGTKHFRHLIESYRGNVVFAVAAYNAGAGNVNRWRRDLGGLAEDEFIESIPFGETRDYVKKVIANAEIYKRLYGLDGTNAPVTAEPAPEEMPMATVQPEFANVSTSTSKPKI